MDDKTAETLRDALAAISAGRSDRACAIAEAGVIAGCEPATLHALIGSIHCRHGRSEAAVTHLRSALDARPDDPIIARNLATSLIACGDWGGALDVLSDALIGVHPIPALFRLRGYAALMAGRLNLAIASYEQCLLVEPGDWESWNNLGNARLEAGARADGIAALRRSVRLNPKSLETRLNLARAQFENGEVQGSEAELRSACIDFPESPRPLRNLADLLIGEGRDRDAERALEGAIQRGDSGADLWVALGRSQLRRFALEDSERSFRTALELEPASAAAFLGLADLVEHSRPDRLGELLAEIEAAGVDGAAAALVRAMVAKRNKAPEEGLLALRHVPESFEPVQRWQLAGHFLDAIGDHSGAFAAFGRMNGALGDEPGRPAARAAELRAGIRGQLGRQTGEWRAAWSAHSTPSGPDPVFLVGFPRSGTTLLDTMLMGHPDIEVMEEQPVLLQLRAEGMEFDRLAAMSESEAERFRHRYWELAGRHCDVDRGALLVDKSPLHMLNVVQIKRLFPAARFILALRHPADCVLSCFMAKFRTNPAMSNFLALDTAAEFYDLAFSSWERSRELFEVDVHEVRYEKLVGSPERVLRGLADWLGLSWDEHLLDHQSTARSRPLVTTASYDQVIQPIYRRAVDRWRSYRRELKPVEALLEPWIERLGYGDQA